MADPNDQCREELILLAIRDGLRNKLSLSEAQCFIAAIPMYHSAQPDTVVQVIDGDEAATDLIDGGQEGGNLVVGKMVTLVVWMRLRYDFLNMTQQALVNESENLRRMARKVQEVFKITTLDGLLYSIPEYRGKTAVVAYEGDNMFRADVVYMFPYAEELPTSTTL